MGKSSKQGKECFSEDEQRKTCLGKNGEKREYREGMLAELEKEVMAVSFLCRELSLTLLQVSQQETSGSIRAESV